MEDLYDVDNVIVPIGGGGLIAGIAVAIKSINPTIRIIGVQSEKRSRHGRPRITPEKLPIIALMPPLLTVATFLVREILPIRSCVN